MDADDLPRWADESLRPPPVDYPAATAADHASGEHLRAIHDMYRRGLAQVGDLVELVAAGDADPAEARAALHGLGLTEAYQTLGSYCGQICSAVQTHHGIEDRFLYPPLRDADDALSATLDRLTHEHEVIHAVLVRLDGSVVRLARSADPGSGAAATPEAGAALVREFRHLRALLESHFRYEEDAIGTALGVHRIGV
ncbi:hemerythrin domain-containing protein [Nocardioides sp.]|uniref:hemerythrin domain-containing protein n=1 Tax=Nocardioides sp. TaxID=35761 RepID=UPI003527FA5E